MKISVNDVELFTLSEYELNLLKNDINSDVLEGDIKRRLEWVLKHKCGQCLKRLEAEWRPKLISKGAESLPTDHAALVALVLADKDYKDRKARDEAEALQE